MLQEASFLKHGEELVVGERTSGGVDHGGGRFAIVATRGSDLVIHGQIGLAEKVRVAVDARLLDTDGAKLFGVVGAIDDVACELAGGDGIPGEIYTEGVAPGLKIVGGEEDGGTGDE